MRISDWSSDVCSSDLDWRNVDRRNFPLPGAVAFFDDLREELENGSGMVKLRGLAVSRYSQGQLRRIWYGLGCHLATPLYQNCRGEVMRGIKDKGMGGGDKVYGAHGDASGNAFHSPGARTVSTGQLHLPPEPRDGG